MPAPLGPVPPPHWRRGSMRWMVSSWRALPGSGLSDVNIEAAVAAEPVGDRFWRGERGKRVAAIRRRGGCGVARRLRELTCARAVAAAAQIEAKRAAIGTQPGIAQRLLEGA